MDNLEKSYCVKITHFVNPYKFFIKLEDSPPIFEKELNKLIEIEALKIKLKYPNGYSPRKYEYIFVYNLPSNKWCRAICEHVLTINKYIEDEFILWDIDNGIPIISSRNYIYPYVKDMPEYFPIFEGSLNNIAPADKATDPITDEKIVIRKKDWHRLATQKIKKLIDDAMEILFIPEAKYGLRHFGKLKIKKYDGTELDVRQELLSQGWAIFSSNFMSDALRSNSFKQDIWKKSDGSLEELIRNQHYFDQNNYLFDEKGMQFSNTDYNKKVESWLCKPSSSFSGQQSELTIMMNFMQMLKSLPEYKNDEQHETESEINPTASMDEICSINLVESMEHFGATIPIKCANEARVPFPIQLHRKKSMKPTYIPAGHECDLQNFFKYNNKN